MNVDTWDRRPIEQVRADNAADLARLQARLGGDRRPSLAADAARAASLRRSAAETRAKGLGRAA